MLELTPVNDESIWQIINDSVMGGVSDGRFFISDQKTLVFFGSLSLENNGGFSSVRTKPRSLGLRVNDELVTRVRGDGREYTINLYLNRKVIAFSYRAKLQTKKDVWIEVKHPLHSFEATSFGRPVKEAGVVDPNEINAIGFMLSDKKAGPFKMEVESIRLDREST